MAMLCDSCRNLANQPCRTPPHRGLTADSTVEVSDGALISYRCRNCRGVWLRFHTNESYRGHAQYWELIAGD